ncbi:tyrosine-type recombinase/integrase [Nocardia sp. NPDC005998]|uniref:tyrosine-type recombinase/integrase n=1 Tax=Nocardia sp. NPDC005998 TaxID=3156894 RepID=UPI0033A612C6
MTGDDYRVDLEQLDAAIDTMDKFGRTVEGWLGEVDRQTTCRSLTWASFETLRLSGIRIEELVELTQLSIRQYRRPDGEVIPLLVIAPSKSDRERVIPMSAELFHVAAQIIRRLTRDGQSIALLPRYDDHEKVWSEPMPYLFQRRNGANRIVLSRGGVLNWLIDTCKELSALNPAFNEIHFTPNDLRRLFATDLANSGLPIRIGAALLGHLNLETFRGYVAVFDEDVVKHYQAHLENRRRTRPADEYREPTAEEWDDFQEHPVDCTRSGFSGRAGCLVWWRDVVWSRTCGGNWPKGGDRSRQWELWSRAIRRTCRS